MITLLYRKKILYPLFQTGDVVYGEGKLRDLGMVFKPSLQCFKNEKINFIQAFLKQETLLFRTCLYYFIIFYIYRAISTQTKKKVSGNLKTCHICKIKPSEH
jgi:hypothetical protein